MNIYICVYMYCWLLIYHVHPLLYWGIFLLFLVSSGLLLWSNVKFYQRLFLPLLRWVCDFLFASFCLCTVLHLLLYKWSILASLEWNQLDQGIRLLNCVVEFSLWIFYWEFLHLYSSRKFIYNFLFLVCPNPVLVS
jgi:hypothetical protein